MNIYLDIDGVLLASDVEPANYVHEFLEYVTGKYPCYWLTTHCKGDAQVTVNHLSRWLKPAILELTSKIKATNWITAKTEAIDWSLPFLWFDDHLFDFEKRDLINHGVLGNWVKVDLSKDPDMLKTYIISFPRPAVSLQ